MGERFLIELAGKNISLKAEGDTTLRGATVTATSDGIDVKTGGTLTISRCRASPRACPGTARW
ncbi:MAG: hemagglutinin repeat-containing protein [Stenotrophomonas sp.]